jgi:hypothetical protein
MKLFLAITLLFAATMGIISCRKEFSNSIVGKWHIVKDSSFLANSLPFYNAGPGRIYYTGLGDDYYDFKPDGNLYIKEGTYSDTLTYNVSSGDQVNLIYSTYNIVSDSFGNIISQTHPTKSYTIVTLSATNLTMSSNLISNILTPVGYLANKLELKK